MIEINKLYNKDCLDLMAGIEDESINLILTDPSYGIDFIPQRKEAKAKYGNIAIANDEKQGKEWVEWFSPIAKESYRVLKNDSVAYFFSGFKVDRYYFEVLEGCGFNIKAVMIWVKNNFGLGYHFRRQYEKIVVAFKGKPPTPDKAISDVIFDAKVNPQRMIHSCQKPLLLLDMLLRQYSKKGDLVLDPMCGSASHLVACIRNERNWIGCELDPVHYNNAIIRLNGNIDIKQENQSIQLKIE